MEKIAAGKLKAEFEIPKAGDVIDEIITYQGALLDGIQLDGEAKALIRKGKPKEGAKLSGQVKKLEYYLGDLIQEIFWKCAKRVNGEPPVGNFPEEVSDIEVQDLMQKFGVELLLLGDPLKNSSRGSGSSQSPAPAER